MPRLFFALWPEPQVTLKLARHRMTVARECGGRALRPETLHLTLAFMGAVAEAHIPEIMACADRVVAHPFDLVIDKVASFDDARIAWLGSTDPPRQLFDLQFSLQSQVHRAGIAVDMRPFLPHITIARNIKLAFPERGIAPIPWPARSYSLVESRSDAGGANYSILKTWTLTEPR